MEREDVLKEINVLNHLMDSANRVGQLKLADAVVVRLTELLKELNK